MFVGLFIGSGGALANGGPAALVIGWGIMGIMLLNVGSRKLRRYAHQAESAVGRHAKLSVKWPCE